MFRQEQDGSLALSSRERQLKSMLISDNDEERRLVHENAGAERFSPFDRTQQTDKLSVVFAPRR